MSDPDQPAPSAPAWLRQVAQSLGHHRVPLLEASCADGVLRLVMGTNGKEALVAELRPRAPGLKGWGVTESFVLGYQGQARLGEGSEGWMSVTLEVIRRLEHVLPPALDEVGAIFLRAVRPEDRFRKSFPFCEVERSRRNGDEVVEVLLRATSRCNQACPFCAASAGRAASAEAVRACTEMAARVYPGCLLSITGGEPTLRPSFLQEVLFALRTDGIGRVQVKTNAVAFAGSLDPVALPVQDDLCFFVSLHALEADLYDACTASSGQFAKAVSGALRLMDAGHQVTINCLVQRLNLEHLAAYVEMLPRIFPVNDRVALHFSVLTCPEHRPEAADYLVRYSELAPRLEAAAARAVALGLRVDPLRSSTQAAMPACLLGEAHRDHDPHRPPVQPGETGHEQLDLPHIKADRCRLCPEDDCCLGLPAAYARRFGLDELQPLLAVAP